LDFYHGDSGKHTSEQNGDTRFENFRQQRIRCCSKLDSATVIFMKQLNLDLGQTHEMISPMPASASPPDKHYPSFHHEGEIDWEDAGITDEGTMTIRYCITRSTETKAEDKPDVYAYDVEIKEI